MIEPGTVLCNIEIGNSLDELVARFSTPDYAGAEVEIWVFDGKARRQDACDALVSRGVKAQVRSAYKPLVHAVLEGDADFSGIKEIRVHYPIVAGVPKNRFLLETYPVDVLVGGRIVGFRPMPPVDGAGLIAYRLELIGQDGTLQNLDIPAPNLFSNDRAGQRIYTPSGWLRVRSDSKPELDCSEAFRTDQENAFDLVMTALATEKWQGSEPFFDRLEMRIEAPFHDTALPLDQECLSTAEAMHEDLYFSALEVFNGFRGHGPADRTLQPGQLVPVIVPKNGPLRVRVSAENDPDIDTDKSVSAAPLIDLDTADHWLEPGQIKAHLEDLGGQPFEARSRRGRPVWSTHIEGPGPNIVITSGQHANETSGPVGALRAARHLTRTGRTGFTVSPLVNPDGYALFRELCRDHPAHMNHAARYTAAGCDLLYVGRGFENEAHHVAREKTGANLHLNLHGYPAHEWTRPFSGYLPRDAEMWSIPRGFMLILLCAPGWQEQGKSILNAIIDELSVFNPVVDFNNEQRERSRLYAGDFPFDHRGGIPYIIEETADDLFPVTIITEAPDETVYGDAFRLFHTVQMKTVLAAAEASPAVFS